jgi:hypothetical protein
LIFPYAPYASLRETLSFDRYFPQKRKGRKGKIKERIKEILM